MRTDARAEVECNSTSRWAAVCKQLFGSLDVDGSGYIDAELLIRIFADLGWSRKRTEKLFRAIDTDGDQRVSYNELLDWLSEKGTKDDVQVSSAAGGGIQPFVQIAERCISVESRVAAHQTTDRETFLQRLHANDFMAPTDPMFWHGRGYEGPAALPKTTWACADAPRDDHMSPPWLTATEFEDVAEVMQAKVAQLANLMTCSSRTVLYTGAGISASAVGQAARSGQHTVGWKGTPKTAPPTFTHFALGLLGMRGLVHSWVQQNHDGLPQKAGFPQERINEVHGSWYDPSNPVVMYGGYLKSEQAARLNHDIEHADLALVLGSTLGGLSADSVPKQAAFRSKYSAKASGGEPRVGNLVHVGGRKRFSYSTAVVTEVRDETVVVKFEDPEEAGEESAEIAVNESSLEVQPGGSLGAACINLQQTPQDGIMTLRIFGCSDDVLRLLLQELGLTCSPSILPVCPENYVLVPYDAQGRRLPAGEGRRMWLNLNVGHDVRITDGHNIQGSQQPKFLHIGATETTTYIGVSREPAEPIGVVYRREDESHSIVLWIAGVEMNLGTWWLDAARRGAVEQLPVVNVRPQYEGDVPEGPRELHRDVGKVWWEIGKIEGYTPAKLRRSVSG